MDQEVVSKKMLLICCLIGVFVLSVIALRFKFSQPTLVACNRDNKITAILHIPPHRQVLFYPDDIDDVSECLGEYMPFYDRTIDVVITNNERSVTLSKLNKRYKITRTLTDGNILFSKGGVELGPGYSTIKSKTPIVVERQYYSSNLHLPSGYRVVMDEVTKDLSDNTNNQLITTEINTDVIEVSAIVTQLKNGSSKKVFID
ncbi:MAG: hypothetical protein ACEQSA_00195 [Weeksellaceae bacterium]